MPQDRQHQIVRDGGPVHRIVRTELETLVPQHPHAVAGSASPPALGGFQASSQVPPDAAGSSRRTSEVVARHELPALPTYAPPPPVISGVRAEALRGAEQSISVTSSGGPMSMRLDGDGRGDYSREAQLARQQLWMTKLILAQWRMTPLDILAPPVARRMIPDDGTTMEEQGTSKRGGGGGNAVARGAAAGLHALQQLWRRKVAEPLVHRDDDALAVWRKAVFAGMMTSSVIIAILNIVAGTISHFVAPIGGIREGGYFILIFTILFLKAGAYLHVRYTQSLSEWASYGFMVLLMAEQHLWLSLNGQHYASVAVLLHSLVLLTWLFASVAPLVKFCGVTTAFVFSTVGFIQSELIHHHRTADDKPQYGEVASNSFNGFLAALLSMQCLFSLCTIGFLLFERQSAKSAREAAAIIQRITKSFALDDYHSALQQLESFDDSALELVSGSAGPMLAMRFADVAQIMKQLRPYIPYHAFRTAVDATPPAAGTAGADGAQPAQRAAGATAAHNEKVGNAVTAAMQPAPPPRGGATQQHEERVGDAPLLHVVRRAPSKMPRHPSHAGISIQGNVLPTHVPEDWEEMRRTSAVTGSSATNSSGGGLGGNGTRRRSLSDDTTTHATMDAAPLATALLTVATSESAALHEHEVTLVLVTFRGRQMTNNVGLLEDAVQVIRGHGGLIELVGYNYLLASFFVNVPAEGGKTIEQQRETLVVVSELRSLFQHRKGATVSAHHGPGWAGLCQTDTRQWRFLGGSAIETLWKMPSVARQCTAMCVATETVIDTSSPCVCPMQLVQLQQNAPAFVVFEVSAGNGLGAAAAAQARPPVSGATGGAVGSPVSKNAAAQQRRPPLRQQPPESPLALAHHHSGAAHDFGGGIQLVVPTANSTRNSMLEAIRQVCLGQPLRASEALRYIQSPSWHIQTWRESLIQGHKQGLQVVYEEWLGWGVIGARPSTLREAYKALRESGDSFGNKFSGSPTIATPSTSTVNVAPPMDWSTTSFGGRVAVSLPKTNSSGGGGVMEPAPPTVFERVAAQLRDRSTALVEQEDCLFSLFVDQDEDAAADDDANDIRLTDSNGRRYVRSSREIGRGAYGSVTPACGEFGGIVAVKCIDLEGRQITASAVEISTEIHTLAQLRHDNIVGYVGDCFKGRYCYIIMEYVPGGSLGDLLQRFKKLQPHTVARYMRDALLGLEYLHKHGVVHCDIKPHNILVTGSGRCKLSDFGSSVNRALEGLLATTAQREPSMSTAATTSPGMQGDGLRVAAGSTAAVPAARASTSDGAFVPLRMPPEHLHLQAHNSLQTQQDGLGSSSIQRSTADSGNHAHGGGGRQPRCSSESSTLDSSQPTGAAFLQPVQNSAKGVLSDQPPPAPAAEQPPAPRYQQFDEPSVEKADPHEELVVRGTAQYMSPEACIHSVGSAESDVWSLGITAYQLMTGDLPWINAARNDAVFIRDLGRNKDPLASIDWARLRSAVGVAVRPTSPPSCEGGLVSALRKPRSDSGVSTPEVTSSMPLGEHALSFIQRCLVVNAEERATIAELLNHPFLTPPSQ